MEKKSSYVWTDSNFFRANFDFGLQYVMEKSSTWCIKLNAQRPQSTHAGLGYVCLISNIQNVMASSLLEQADALLLDSGAVRPRCLLFKVAIQRLNEAMSGVWGNKCVVSGKPNVLKVVRSHTNYENLTNWKVLLKVSQKYVKMYEQIRKRLPKVPKIKHQIMDICKE